MGYFIFKFYQKILKKKRWFPFFIDILILKWHSVSGRCSREHSSTCSVQIHFIIIYHRFPHYFQLEVDHWEILLVLKRWWKILARIFHQKSKYYNWNKYLQKIQNSLSLLITFCMQGVLDHKYILYSIRIYQIVGVNTWMSHTAVDQGIILPLAFLLYIF